MKKILVISPGPFVETDNDGLTLMNLFRNWDKRCLAQCYFNALAPDRSFCSNILQITDRQVLNELVMRHRTEIKQNSNEATRSKARVLYKNPITLLLRDALWSMSPWQVAFYIWVQAFSPDAIFFEVGDNAYMMRFVRRLKMRLKIPLIIHNTEGFYLFKKSYMLKAPKWTNYLYPYWHVIMRYQYRMLMKKCDFIIYSCDKLSDAFSQEYKLPSRVIYNGSFIKPSPYIPKTFPNLVISYAGGLGLYRPLALIEVADVLKEINPMLKIEVYGNCKDEKEKLLLQEHPNINYNGLVSYSKVQEVISDSDILLHVEYPLATDNIEFGFSTKIPDSLSSGRCFFSYTPKDVAGSEYLMKYIPDIVANSKDELRDKLSRIIFDENYRCELIKKCIYLSQKNHDIDRISEEVKNIIDAL